MLQQSGREGECEPLRWVPAPSSGVGYDGSMDVRLHSHARERAAERGATEAEVIATVRSGERFPAKYGRTGFRRNFAFNAEWMGRWYRTKQLEALAVEGDGWLVISVLVKYF